MDRIVDSHSHLDAAEFDAFAVEAGEARLWAGLHVRSDVTAGIQLAHDVAGAVIEYAEKDGSKKE